MPPKVGYKGKKKVAKTKPKKMAKARSTKTKNGTKKLSEKG